MNPELVRRLEQLRDDRISGALDLAVKAVDIALAAPADWTELASEFQAMHPAIVTVANVGRLLERARVGSLPDLVALRQSLLEGNRAIASHLAAVVPHGARVLTISHSSTVECAVRTIEPAQVYVLESLPGGEGRRLAEKIGATVAPDAAMGATVPLVDYALVGIDAFDSSGAILHKLGTLPLALCCARFQKPFYAAGHSFKRSPVDTRELLARAAGAPFDRTSAELITAIITERGPLPERGRGPM